MEYKKFDEVRIIAIYLLGAFGYMAIIGTGKYIGITIFIIGLIIAGIIYFSGKIKQSDNIAENELEINDSEISEVEDNELKKLEGKNEESR